MDKNIEIVEIDGVEQAKCSWCGELHPIDEMRKEVDMGYLCPTCIRAIKSRGETLTFED